MKTIQSEVIGSRVAFPSQWRTAAVFDRSLARRFMVRLDYCHIDYSAAIDGLEIRISVRANDLETALALCPDNNLATRTVNRSGIPPAACRRLLYSIPLGGGAGSLISYFATIESPIIPFVGSAMMIAVVELVVANQTTKRTSFRRLNSIKR